MIAPKIDHPLVTDSVMAEVHRVKDELAKQFDYDVEAMLDDIMKRQWDSGHVMIERARAEQSGE